MKYRDLTKNNIVLSKIEFILRVQNETYRLGLRDFRGIKPPLWSKASPQKLFWHTYIGQNKIGAYVRKEANLENCQKRSQNGFTDREITKRYYRPNEKFT